MNLLSRKKLIQGLRDETISERDYGFYAIALNVIIGLWIYRVEVYDWTIKITFWNSSGYSGMIICGSLIVVCHIINKLGDDKNFLNRLISLSVVNILRICIVAVPLGYLVSFIGVSFDNDWREAFKVNMVLWVLSGFYFILSMIKSMALAANTPPQSIGFRGEK